MIAVRLVESCAERTACPRSAGPWSFFKGCYWRIFRCFPRQSRRDGSELSSSSSSSNWTRIAPESFVTVISALKRNLRWDRTLLDAAAKVGRDLSIFTFEVAKSLEVLPLSKDP